MPSRRDFFGSLVGPTLGITAGLGSAGGMILDPFRYNLDPRQYDREKRLEAQGSDVGIYDVTEFGARGDGQTDDTEAVQAAIRAAASTGGRVVFPHRGPWSLGTLNIGASLEITGRDAVLAARDPVLLSVVSPVKYLRVSGLSFSFPTFPGRQGREAFRNYTSAAVPESGFTHYATDMNERYSVGRLLLEDCDFSVGKVTVSGEETVCWVRGCRWASTSSDPTTSPYYFAFLPGGSERSASRCYFTENHLSVYPPSGLNQDVVKISGLGQMVTLAHNHVENRNPDCEAQIDFFTGATGARVLGNVLVNTQFLRKQTGTVDVDSSFDTYAFNFVRLDPGHRTADAFVLRGTLWKAVGNDIHLADPTSVGTAFFLDNEESADFDEFGTDMPTGFVLAGNTCDARQAHPQSRFVQYEGEQGQGGLGIVSGNLFLGGERFLAGTPPRTTIVGNVWGSSDGARGMSVNSGEGSLSVGNVADSDASKAKESGTDRVRRSLHEIEPGACEPDVSRGGIYVTKNADTTRITALRGGREGQRILLLVKDDRTQLAHDAADGNLHLRGRNALAPRRGDVLEFVYDGSTWFQTGAR